MSNNLNQLFIEGQSWLDCIGDLINKSYLISTEQQVIVDDPIFINATDSPPTNLISFKMSAETQSHQMNDQQQNPVRKRPYSTFQSTNDKKQVIQQNVPCNNQNEQQSQKQQSKQSQNKNKFGKQSQYSKSYRQRKKELLKMLQEQNTYLKQKINQLQNRLREKQLQINRLKHAPQQKQFSVQQLNEQFLKKTNLLLSKATIDPINYCKTNYCPQEKLYQQFMNSYEERGFGGVRKKNTLNYYFNELLQSTLRDSEKYLFLICNHYKEPSQIKGLQTYQQIDLIFQQIMQLDEDKAKRINHFTNNLHSFMRELKTICSDMCVNFNRILVLIEKVHNFMKASYPHNMDFARKRIQLENWFEHNKHTKLIRRLRSDWLEFIKKSAQDQTQQKNNMKNKKKKKTNQQKQFP